MSTYITSQTGPPVGFSNEDLYSFAMSLLHAKFLANHSNTIWRRVELPIPVRGVQGIYTVAYRPNALIVGSNWTWWEDLCTRFVCFFVFLCGWRS
jgi:hypothetical protein